MPLDMLPIDPDIDQLARMELLGEIAAKNRGSQGSFRTCLWSAVRSRTSKARALVKDLDEGAGSAPSDPGTAAKRLGFFLKDDEQLLFGMYAIEWKRDFIAGRIKAQKAKIARKIQRRVREIERQSAEQKETADAV